MKCKINHILYIIKCIYFYIEMQDKLDSLNEVLNVFISIFWYTVLVVFLS